MFLFCFCVCFSDQPANKDVISDDLSTTPVPNGTGPQPEENADGEENGTNVWFLLSSQVFGNLKYLNILENTCMFKGADYENEQFSHLFYASIWVSTASKNISNI